MKRKQTKYTKESMNSTVYLHHLHSILWPTAVSNQKEAIF